MFFCRVDHKSCLKLKSILHKYELASGQKINQIKSAITFSTKTPLHVRERVKRDLDIHKEGGQGKYLGLPELFGRKKKDLFTSIVDWIKQKALSWSLRFLSSAGKLTMLKSVLSSLPTYTMSCFQLPASLCKRIQSALTRFWWDANPEKKKMSWISWQRMTKSFKTGGLGLRDIQTFNKALLAKLSWRILKKPSCLLAKILLRKYCKHASFLDCRVPNSASHGWRSICLGRDLISLKLGRIIGKGESTPIWRNPWLSLSSPLSPIGPPTEATQHMLVSDLILPGTREWNKDLIRTILPLYEKDILLLTPSLMGAPDIWAWLPTSSGDYTAKYGYFEALKINEDQEVSQPDSSELFNWRSNVWAIKTSPKTKLLLWKAGQNALPVGTNLLHRHISVSAKCPHCEADESVLHLLFQCPFARKIWSLALFQSRLNIDGLTSVLDGIAMANKLICLPPTGIGSGPLSPWLIWTIWTSRNQFIFNKLQITAEEALQIALIRAKEWQDAQSPKSISTACRQPFTLTRPAIPIRTCFTDASWKDNGKAGFGWICKDDSGKTIFERLLPLHLLDLL